MAFSPYKSCIVPMFLMFYMVLIFEEIESLEIFSFPNFSEIWKIKS